MDGVALKTGQNVIFANQINQLTEKVIWPNHGLEHTSIGWFKPNGPYFTQPWVEISSKACRENRNAGLSEMKFLLG